MIITQGMGYGLYWVGQKVRSGFSVTSYEKPKQTFWPTLYLTRLKREKQEWIIL